jgi:hypothetical protein
MADNDHSSFRSRPEMEMNWSNNEELPFSPEVLETINELVQKRREVFLERQRAQDELMRAMAIGPQELRQQAEAMRRIFRKLDILSEAEELSRSYQRRERRITEAADRLTDLQGGPSEQQEGR